MRVSISSRWARVMTVITVATIALAGENPAYAADISAVSNETPKISASSKSEAKAAAKAKKAAAKAERAAQRAAVKAAKKAAKAAKKAAKAEARAKRQLAKAQKQAAKVAARIQKATKAAAKAAAKADSKASAAAQATGKKAKRLNNQANKAAKAAAKAQQRITKLQAKAAKLAAKADKLSGVSTKVNTPVVAPALTLPNGVKVSDNLVKVISNSVDKATLPKAFFGRSNIDMPKMAAAEKAVDSLSLTTKQFLAERVAARNPALKAANDNLVKAVSRADMVRELASMPRDFASLADNLSPDQLANLATASGGEAPETVVNDLYGEDGEGLIFMEVKLMDTITSNNGPISPVNIDHADQASRAKRGKDNVIVLSAS